jgi:hypothetical protein
MSWFSYFGLTVIVVVMIGYSPDCWTLIASIRQRLTSTGPGSGKPMEGDDDACPAGS